MYCIRYIYLNVLKKTFLILKNPVSVDNRYVADMCICTMNLNMLKCIKTKLSTALLLAAESIIKLVKIFNTWTPKGRKISRSLWMTGVRVCVNLQGFLHSSAGADNRHKKLIYALYSWITPLNPSFQHRKKQLVPKNFQSNLTKGRVWNW